MKLNTPHNILAIGIVLIVAVYVYTVRNNPVPIWLEMIFGHPIGVFLCLLAVIALTIKSRVLGVASAVVFLLLNDAVMNKMISQGLRKWLKGERGRGRERFITNMEQIETQDSGEYNRIMENQVLENETNCANPTHKNLADAIESCNTCKDCSGITYMNGDFELRKGPGIVSAPTDTIATTWLKPENPDLTGNYIGLNIPGANEEITRNLVPNCMNRCTAEVINNEFQEKRIQFFGLPKDSPDMPITKTAFTPNQTKPNTGGGKWMADETYIRVPDTLDRCSVSYLLDADSRNEWVMDAYMNPMEKCRIQVLAQNEDNIFDGKTVTLADAYGGNDSLFGPMAFQETI